MGLFGKSKQRAAAAVPAPRPRRATPFDDHPALSAVPTFFLGTEHRASRELSDGGLNTPRTGFAHPGAIEATDAGIRVRDAHGCAFASDWSSLRAWFRHGMWAAEGIPSPIMFWEFATKIDGIDHRIGLATANFAIFLPPSVSDNFVTAVRERYPFDYTFYNPEEPGEAKLLPHMVA